MVMIYGDFPFHESVIGAIHQASSREAFTTLAGLIVGTRIPKGHEAIIQAWNDEIFAAGLGSESGLLNVVDVIRAKQKEAERQRPTVATGDVKNGAGDNEAQT